MPEDKPAAGRRAFRSDVQGLRAVAVGLVLIYHAGVPWLGGGFVGVDVFFVISGYLITGHLAVGLAREGRVDLAAFWAKRARRILPASVATLLLSLVAAAIWMPPLALPAVFRDAAATALYVPNLLFAVQGTDYLAETSPSVFQQYWSLGVEEQFYLIWPIALMVAFAVGRRSRRSLIIFTFAIVLVSFAVCVLLTGSSQPWAFFSLPSRAWEFGIGGLIALVGDPLARRVSATARAALGWTGLLAIVSGGAFLSAELPFPGVVAILPVVGTALVILCGNDSRLGPARLLSIHPLQWIGKISYSLYLVHWPLIVIPAAAITPADLPIAVSVGLALLAVPLAYVLYRLVEEPGRRSRVFVEAGGRRTLLFVAASSAVIALISVVAIPAASARSLTSGDDAQAYEVSQSPRAADTVPANLKPSLWDAADDIPALYATGCHRDFESVDSKPCRFGSNESAPMVALFGDSHAAHWFPALKTLADAGTIRLETFTKSSCPSASVEILRDGSSYSECVRWRGAVIERLQSEPPALTVLSNMRSVDAIQGPPQDWDQGLGETITMLVPSQQVLVIADTPSMSTSPALCLSAHLNDASTCATQRSEALSSDSGLTNVRSAGGELLDLNDYLCDDQLCPAIIDDLLVYRDEHHLTAEFSRSMAPVFVKAIGQLLNRAAAPVVAPGK
ncbi:peptidoglycan/LPS O-acetylase OafA/YrhL [Labedella gwakjiensis]|uniref:Acyltransferase n=1 Tax=Labedella gwakjiensis TaxID=390269 RepID=A0A2P8GY79_9MICO|nr:acyltransferase family protein [Labedella gwakjiensis]PSL38919.1 peptidoglycan/LPS O-acetylase OafA/YrhL [Labedella gwakjiensis]RUQ86618.1 acyltransferase [Labedella gwakjiensis]